MTKIEVIQAFCKLSNEIRTEVFNDDVPADCFCHDNVFFQFDRNVLAWIKEAVQEKLQRELKKMPS